MHQNAKNYLVVHYLCFVFTCFVSVYFGGLYTEGDQYFYNLWFDEIQARGLVQGYLYYASQVNYFEVLHFMTNWVGGLFTSKLVLYTFVNCVFCWYLVRALKSLGFHPVVALLIVVTNFYVPVLLLAAERLKFGFLMLFIFVLVREKRTNLTILFMTLLGHLQFLLLWVSVASGLVLQKISRRNALKTIPKKFFVLPIFGFLLLILFKDHLMYKLLAYLKFGGIENIVKPMIFMAFSIYCCSSKKALIIGVFWGLSVASFILGSERITIFAFVVFLYFSSFRSRGFNIPNLLLIPYFGIKSYEFYTNIIEKGTGF